MDMDMVGINEQLRRRYDRTDSRFEWGGGGLCWHSNQFDWGGVLEWLNKAIKLICKIKVTFWESLVWNIYRSRTDVK